MEGDLAVCRIASIASFIFLASAVSILDLPGAHLSIECYNSRPGCSNSQHVLKLYSQPPVPCNFPCIKTATLDKGFSCGRKHNLAPHTVTVLIVCLTTGIMQEC